MQCVCININILYFGLFQTNVMQMYMQMMPIGDWTNQSREDHSGSDESDEDIFDGSGAEPQDEKRRKRRSLRSLIRKKRFISVPDIPQPDFCG